MVQHLQDDALLRVPLRFNAIETALAFRSEWLEHHLPAADADLRRLLQEQVDALDWGRDATLADRVRGVLRTAHPDGHGAVEDIAPTFSMVHHVNRHDTGSSDFKDCDISRATVDELWRGGRDDIQKVQDDLDACKTTDYGNGVRVFHV